MAITPKGKSVVIPVTAVPSTRPRRLRPAPKIVSKISKPAITKEPAQPVSARQPKPQLSEERRRKIMWGVVAVGATLVVIGWVVTLGPALRRNSGETKLLQDIANLFKSQTKKTAPAENPEIRSLEQEVFPQFQR